MNLNISRLLETSKFLNTKAGQELSDFIQYVSDLAEKVVRALQNNLTIAENMDAKVSVVRLQHGTAQVVGVGGRKPIGIVPMQVLSTSVGVTGFIWYINSNGDAVVNISLTGSPSGLYDVSLAIFFG